MPTKQHRIEEAYKIWLRISGATRAASSDELDDGLAIMENMMWAFKGSNIGVGYYFENTPVLGTFHGMARIYWTPVASLLAHRMAVSFGKGKSLDPGLVARSNADLSFLHSNTALVRPNQYPGRMPLGQAQTLWWGNRVSRFYDEVAEAPLSSQTQTLLIGDIKNYTEDWSNFARGGTITAVVAEADDGLNILSEALATPLFNFQVEAVGTDSNNPPNAWQRIELVATNSAGEEEKRIWNFQLIDPGEIPAT